MMLFQSDNFQFLYWCFMTLFSLAYHLFSPGALHIFAWKKDKLICYLETKASRSKRSVGNLHTCTFHMSGMYFGCFSVCTDLWIIWQTLLSRVQYIDYYISGLPSDIFTEHFFVHWVNTLLKFKVGFFILLWIVLCCTCMFWCIT